MRKSTTAAIAAITFVALGSPALVANAAPASAPDTSGSYIVVLKDGAAAGKVAQEHSRRYDAQVGHVYRSALKGYSARMSPRAVDRSATASSTPTHSRCRPASTALTRT
jgi:subtilisin